MKNTIFLFFLLFSFRGAGAQTILPGNDEQFRVFGETVVKSILWENYWKGRWSKGVYWKKNKIDEFLNKKSFDAMLVPVEGGDNEDDLVVDVYIDELSSRLSFLKKNGAYYLIAVNDSWFNGVDGEKEYFEVKKNNSRNAVRHKFKIGDQCSAILVKRDFSSSDCREIESLFDNSVFSGDEMSFVKRLGKHRFLNGDFKIKVSLDWGGYPCVFYIIEGLPDYYGWIAFDPQTNRIVTEYIMRWKDLADSNHYLYLTNKLEKFGTEFNFVNWKAKCR